MANETLPLKNINILTEEQYKLIPENEISDEELYMIPIFDNDGRLVFPNGTLLWVT